MPNRAHGVPVTPEAENGGVREIVDVGGTFDVQGIRGTTGELGEIWGESPGNSGEREKPGVSRN